MINNIKKIILVLNNKERKKFKILIFMMFFAMLLETLGISAMIPLINYFTNENILLPFNLNLSNLTKTFNISDKNILNFCLILIITIYLIKNLYLVFYGWLESKFSYKVRFDLGVKLFKDYLKRPYSYHIENNSSVLLTKIVQETTIYGASLIQLSTLITEILIILGIGAFLMIIKPIETFIIILIGFILSLTFYFLLKNTIQKLGQKRELAQKSKIKSLQQGLGAIKDIIIYQVENNFINIFKKNSDDVAEVGFKMHFLQKLPRIWFEITTLGIIIFVIFFLSVNNSETSEIMATMAIFLFSSLRLIPSINRIIVALQNIKYSEPSIHNLSSDLDKIRPEENINSEKNNEGIIEFEDNIEFNNVCFNYPKNNKKILENINLKIKKNEFIGIVGETGSGKSTLVDLLIGLLKPTTGTITVDSKDISKSLNSWKKNLGYVPQNLYLLDDTIQNNIAFGKKENEILNLEVKRSIEQSQLSQFINNLNDGLKTVVGERGVKISGGEKQRVGIGRALYNNPKVLIFDEATSALDLDTEKKILETLNYLKNIKTIIFITHRTSNLNICDKVFKIENNKITELKK